MIAEIMPGSPNSVIISNIPVNVSSIGVAIQCDMFSSTQYFISLNSIQKIFERIIPGYTWNELLLEVLPDGVTLKNIANKNINFNTAILLATNYMNAM